MTTEAEKQYVAGIETEAARVHQARMQKIHDEHAATMAEIHKKHEARMKELDDEWKRGDRMMKWIMGTLIVVSVGVTSAAVYVDAKTGSDRDRWAHQFCRQTCRALDYRPLMFYRLPRLEQENEAATRHSIGSNRDGLICRCAGPNDTIHLYDEDGDGQVLSGRDYERHLQLERDTRAREVMALQFARERGERSIETEQIVVEIEREAAEVAAARGKNQ